MHPRHRITSANPKKRSNNTRTVNTHINPSQKLAQMSNPPNRSLKWTIPQTIHSNEQFLKPFAQLNNSSDCELKWAINRTRMHPVPGEEIHRLGGDFVKRQIIDVPSLLGMKRRRYFSAHTRWERWWPSVWRPCGQQWVMHPSFGLFFWTWISGNMLGI